MDTSPQTSTARKPSSPKPPKAAPRKGALAVSLPSAAESLKEANRLIDEGLLIRYASVQRYFKLRGPLDFTATTLPNVPNVREFSELVPKFLKKQPPAGWVITDEGFVYAVDRPDAAVIAKHVNARSDELGVYSCKRDNNGWRLVFEF